MKLKNKIVSHGKAQTVYGLPGDVVVLISPEDHHKLNRQNEVVAVRQLSGKGTPFPVIVKDLEM